MNKILFVWEKQNMHDKCLHFAGYILSPYIYFPHTIYIYIYINKCSKNIVNAPHFVEYTLIYPPRFNSNFLWYSFSNFFYIYTLPLYKTYIMLLCILFNPSILYTASIFWRIAIQYLGFSFCLLYFNHKFIM